MPIIVFSLLRRQRSVGDTRVDDRRRVIDQAVDLGVGMVQFIGGEPTLHPELSGLVDHALTRDVEVEVFSNLVRVTPRLWETFGRDGVRLACSYYSPSPEQHAAVTGRAGSHTRTRANIIEALARSIPLRVGVVDLGGDQGAELAMTELTSLGVTDVRYDRLRQVGRGQAARRQDMDQLCGHCASDVLAISPTGEVWPCVFSRWLPVGNVRTTPLAEILADQPVANVRSRLREHFGGTAEKECVPDMCDPQCGPNCGPACMPQGSANPCGPRGGCMPNYDD